MSITADVTINGTPGPDVLPTPAQAAPGLNLLINGLGGNDTFVNNVGDDHFFGDEGNDTLLAGQGNDSYDGGAGDDTYDASQLFTTFGFGGRFVFGFGGLIEKGNIGNDTIGQFEVDFFGQITEVNPIENIIAPIGVNNNLADLSPLFPTQNEDAFATVDLENEFITLFDAATDAEIFTVNIVNFDDVIGTRFADTLIGDGQQNDIFGRAGNDTITGNGGNDRLLGNVHDDSLIGNAGNDTLNGGNGDDILLGGGNNDTLIGGNDQDLLDGEDGNDRGFGQAGNDTFIASTGNDSFVGGTGTDTYDASQLINTEGPLGGAFVFGFGGQITKGALGDDVIGRFVGNNAEPIEIVIGPENAPMGENDNVADLSAGPGQNPVASSIVDLENESIELFLGDISNNVPLFEVTAINFNNIVGTNFGDELTGNGNDNIILGGDGNDTFFGTAGNDSFSATGGTDNVADYSELDAAITFRQAGIVLKGVTDLDDTVGALGQDQLGTDEPFTFIQQVIGDADEINNINNGGGSNISVEVDLDPVNGFVTATVEVAITGIPGIQDIPAGTAFTVAIENFTNAIGTTDFGDSLTGNDDANELRGLGGADSLFGGSGNDTLFGQNANDNLFGQDDNDRIAGNLGNDTLNGGSGNDTLIGGQGADNITTGGNADSVVFVEDPDADTVTDFNADDGTLRFFQITGLTNANQLTFTDTGPDLDISFNSDLIATLLGLAGNDANTLNIDIIV